MLELQQHNDIFLCISFHAKTVVAMFSGEMPQEGATYGFRAQNVTDKDGVVSVEMQFVRIDKE